MGLREDPVYTRVAGWTEQYDSVGAMMHKISNPADEGLVLVREQNDTWIYLYREPEATWFQTFVVCNLENPLHQCMVPMNETDLAPEWQENLTGPPQHIGKRQLLHQVTHSSTRFLLSSFDMVIETVRIPNMEYGSLVECIRSDFPHGDLEIPPPGWFVNRAQVNTTNVWVPRGGGKKGTVLTQSAVVNLSFVPPQFLVDFFVTTSLNETLTKFKSVTLLSSDSRPDNPWRERLLKDQNGFYAMLKQIEAAADSRAEVDAASPPGREVVLQAHRMRRTKSPKRKTTKPKE